MNKGITWLLIIGVAMLAWFGGGLVKARMNAQWEPLGSGLSRRTVEGGTVYRQSHSPADSGSDLMFVPFP